MPAAFCDDSRPYQFTVDGVCDFFVDWTHDGTSVPPGCDGPIRGIRWVNRSNTTYYAHLPETRLGPFTQVIAPNASGSETRSGVLNNVGLQTLGDIASVVINTNPAG